MKINEIRIGNWYNPEHLMQIEASDYMNIKVNDLAYPSIPLSEEWLEKLGFELTNGYYMNSIDSFRAQIRVKRKVNEFQIWIVRNNSRVWINTINYVHELQNLYYSITLTELKTKL